MKEITVEAAIEQIETVTEFVNLILEDAECSVKTRMHIDIAIDELLGNIANYAYPDGYGTATIHVDIPDDPKAVVLTITDEGIPYNPLNAEKPDITLSAEERSIGGLGIHMVKKIMDEIRYRREDGKNILQIKKYI